MVTAIEEFLGVAAVLPEGLGERYHVGGSQRRFPNVQRRLRRSPVGWVWKRVPQGTRSRLFIRFDHWNVRPDAGDSDDDDTRPVHTVGARKRNGDSATTSHSTKPRSWSDTAWSFPGVDPPPTVGVVRDQRPRYGPGGMKIRTFSEAEIERFAVTFPKAEPYPHLVIEDFLVGDPSDALRFPAPDWAGWRRYEGSEYQPEKMICDDIERIPDEFARAHPRDVRAVVPARCWSA